MFNGFNHYCVFHLLYELRSYFLSHKYFNVINAHYIYWRIIKFVNQIHGKIKEMFGVTIVHKKYILGLYLISCKLQSIQKIWTFWATGLNEIYRWLFSPSIIQLYLESLHFKIVRCVYLHQEGIVPGTGKTVIVWYPSKGKYSFH